MKRDETGTPRAPRTYLGLRDWRGEIPSLVVQELPKVPWAWRSVFISDLKPFPHHPSGCPDKNSWRSLKNRKHAAKARRCPNIMGKTKREPTNDKVQAFSK